VTLSKRPANVRFPLEIVQDRNAKMRNLVDSRSVAHVRQRSFMQNLFDDIFERKQRSDTDLHPVPDADENPSEDVLIRLRPNT